MHSKYEVFGPQVCDGEHTTGLHAFWSRKNTQNTIETWRQKPNYLIYSLLFTMCLRHHLHVGFSCFELTWNLEALVSLFTANLLSYTVLVKCLRLCVSARVSAFPWACRRAHKTLCNSRVWNLSGVAQRRVSVPMTGCQTSFRDRGVSRFRQVLGHLGTVARFSSWLNLGVGARKHSGNFPSCLWRKVYSLSSPVDILKPAACYIC